MKQTINEIGKTLRSLRSAYKVTQMEMSKFCKIHPRQYQRIEAGRANMGIETFLTLIKFFDLDPCDFFRLVEPSKSSSPKSGKQECNIEEFANFEMRRFLILNSEISYVEPLMDALKRNCVDILFQNKQNLQDAPYIACHLDQNHQCQWTNTEGVRFWGLKNGESRLCCQQHPPLGSEPEQIKEICYGPSRGAFWCCPCTNGEGLTKCFVVILFPVYKMVNVKSQSVTRLCFDVTDLKIEIPQLFKSF